MTLPKPIYDWLSSEAERLGVTVQDRIRVILEKCQVVYSEYVNLYGISAEKEKKQWSIEELQETCYSIGKPIYDVFATERKRLQVIPLSDDSSVMFYKESGGNEIIIPVITKSFYPLDYANELLELKICSAAKQVAELENKLLSVCEDEDNVYQAMPFRCHIWYRAGVWEGAFRLCVNTPRTPTLADVARATS